MEKRTKIVMVTHHFCIRVIKEGIALQNTGYDVHYLSNKRELLPSYFSTITQCSFYDGREQLIYQLRNIRDIDIVHVHNEPSWMVAVAKEALPNVPVIFDAHDLQMMRDEKHRVSFEIDEEQRAIQLADGFFFPSQAYLAGVDVGSRPAEIIHSMCNEELLDLEPIPAKIDGIVYEGGIVSPDDPQYDYRNFIPLCKVLNDANIPFFMQIANRKPAIHYANAGAIVLPPTDYPVFMRSLSRYSWGFVGSVVRDSLTIKSCMPNKLFEYIMAGIPVIVHGSDEAEWFVEEFDVGIVVDTLNDIPDLFHKRKDVQARCQANAMKLRSKFTMESQLDKLKRVYDAVLGIHAKMVGMRLDNVTEVPTCH